MSPERERGREGWRNLLFRVAGPPSLPRLFLNRVSLRKKKEKESSSDWWIRKGQVLIYVISGIHVSFLSEGKIHLPHAFAVGCEDLAL